MITGKTSVVGIIGDPVEHSLSPPMHNAAFKHLELDFVYVPFQVKRTNLEKVIRGARAMNIKGLNVTIPHKTEVISYLDEVDRAADMIGAVNTIKFDEDSTRGFNTDGMGAIRALEEIVKTRNKKVIIIGAGGAARAIGFQLVLGGVGELLIANRTIENATKLSKDLNERTDFSAQAIGLVELENELHDTEIMINTTPVGMYPHDNDDPIVTSNWMHPDLVVNDIVYNPLKTRLLEEAEKAGAKTVNGVKMLVYQGAEAFQIWTGVKPPVELMLKSFMDAFNTQING
jgi:shikimate dehydrogenase